MFELHSIEKACEWVPGGLQILKIIDPNDLVTQPEWNVSVDAGELEFKPGKAAYTFEQDRVSGSLEDEIDTSNAAGDFTTYRLKATVKVIRPTVEALRAKLMNRRVHVIATNMDDLQRFVPYMRLSSKSDSGARQSDRNGYSFQGLTRCVLPGPGVGGNIETVPGGGGTDPGGGGTGTAQAVVITTSSSTHTYMVPTGKWLVGWEVRGSSDQSVSLGLTPGGNELGGPVDLAALQVWTAAGNQIPSFFDTNIYFSGLTGTNTIKLWFITG